MKPRRQSSIDGFVPRRPTQQPVRQSPERTRRPVSTTGDVGLRRPTARAAAPTSPTLHRSAQGLDRSEEGMRHSGQSLSRNDIDESLNAINEPVEKKISKRRQRRLRKTKKPMTRKRRIIKWTIITVLILGLLFGGWFAYKILSNGGSVFKGGLLGLIQTQPLKQDSNGRSNILVLGTSDDDPNHPGGDLTDSMMVVSIDQNSKTAAMFSIPRDLYVEYGMACPSGYQGKINAYFSCANPGTGAEAEQDRLKKTRDFIGNIFDMDIQYSVNVNNTVIVEAVDAVGGVDVDIKGNGPVPYGVEAGSILDRNFDWRCNYQCNYVKYSPGVHHLDGKHALYLSMARGHSAPTYGLVDSNFDREKNQQKIMVALKDKAVSTGTLTNIGKVTALMDALGNNLRTTFETSEIRTLAKLGTEVDTSNIVSISLFGEEDAVVTTGNYGGASVVMPSAGIFNYAEIQKFIAKKLSTNPVVREGANIVVANGSGVAGVAQTEADKLDALGYSISGIVNAPEGTYAPVTIYKISEGMNLTKEKLSSRLGVEITTAAPPMIVAPGTDFLVIFGVDRSAKTQ